MAARKRSDIPNKILDLGSRFQELEHVRALGPLYVVLANIIVGSKSEAYVRIKFEKVEELVDENGEPTQLPVAEADPSSNKFSELIQRRKRNGVVVGAAKAAMTEVLVDHIYTLPHTTVRPAVAFTFRNETRAGILPYGLRDYGLTGDHFTAALREGTEDFGAGIGIWVPHERKLVAPASNAIVEQHIDVDSELTRKYPDTPLV